MTEEQAQAFLAELEQGQKYVQNLDSSREGVRFLQYRKQGKGFCIQQGMHYFDYDEEQWGKQTSLDTAQMLERLLELNLAVLRPWEQRK